MTMEYNSYLAHYGVKGQKWGQRQWQNEDGTYTEAGKHHYGWGYGRQTNSIPQIQRPTMVRRPVSQQRQAIRPQPQPRNQPTQAEIEARKARTRKIFAICAGVAVTAALAYAAYRGSTKLRNNMRSEVFKRFNTDANNVHTLHSKYWTAADRAKYTELTKKRAEDVASSLTRRDAVAAKIQDKLGVKINVHHSRQKIMQDRISENRYANFIRDAEKRGYLNKRIHDARAELRDAEKKLNRYRSIDRMGTSKKYENFFDTQYQRQITDARGRLDDLLKLRRAG